MRELSQSHRPGAVPATQFRKIETGNQARGQWLAIRHLRKSACIRCYLRHGSFLLKPARSCRGGDDDRFEFVVFTTEEEPAVTDGTDR
jgi:hypothetical protein